MCCVIKAMPIHFINGEWHKATEKICKSCLTNQRALLIRPHLPILLTVAKRQANKLKSCKTCLTSYLQVHFT